MKRLTLTSIMLTSLMTFGGVALADSNVAPDEGVDAGVEGHNVPPQQPEEQTESANIDNASNGSATSNNELAEDSGVTAKDENPSLEEAQNVDKQTSYDDQELAEDEGLDAGDDDIGDDAP